MTDRLAVLDKNRKSILALPSAALHLWMCYWMNEDDEQESYMSLDEIEEQMDYRMSRRSIITWTKWLVRGGWLLEIPDKTAADKWLQRGRPATRGAYQIEVYRVDDPKKGSLCQTLASAQSAPVQFAHKVSGSGSGSSSVSHSGSRSATEATSSSESDEEACVPHPPNEKPNLEPKTKNRKPKPPKGFDSWSLEDRLAWSQAKRGTGEGNASAAPQPPLSAKQTENQKATPTNLCCFCNEKPQRSPTSDYCPDCWNRKQRGEKLEVHPAFKQQKKAGV